MKRRHKSVHILLENFQTQVDALGEPVVVAIALGEETVVLTNTKNKDETYDLIDRITDKFIQITSE